MKLSWSIGRGPGTTQKLADVVEAEGRLGRFRCYDSNTGLRCILGVMHDYTSFCKNLRRLDNTSQIDLARYGVSVSHNDALDETPEGLCKEMVRRLRAIP